jgi:hypothetical protein
MSTKDLMAMNKFQCMFKYIFLICSMALNRRDEPETVPEQPSRQGRDGQAQVGQRVQRLPRLHRRIHEPSARSDRRVHRFLAFFCRNYCVFEIKRRCSCIVS